MSCPDDRPNLNYDWQYPVYEALCELSPQLLPGKINTAERAIAAKLVDERTLDIWERLALADAVRTLKELFHSEATPDLFAEANQTTIKIILNDLDLALAFASLAGTFRYPENRRRSQAAARKAFLDIQRVLLPRCQPDESTCAVIAEKLAELRRSLERSDAQL